MAQTHGGKRPGAGRRPSTDSKNAQLSTRVHPQDAATLRQYNQSQAVAWLAAGLRLGRGNLPDLTDAERVLLADVLPAAPDVLALRHLEDDLRDLEPDDEGGDLPERESLIAKLAPLGDWERLALLLGRV